MEILIGKVGIYDLPALDQQVLVQALVLGALFLLLGLRPRLELLEALPFSHLV